MPDDLFRRAGRHENIDIADRLAKAAEAPRDGDLLHFGELRERGDDSLREGKRDADRRAGARAAQKLEPLENILLGFRFHLRELPDAMIERGVLELVERVDPELGLQAHGGLRPDAGNAEHVEEHRGSFLAELVQIIDLAALEVLGDLGGEVLPDAGELEERSPPPATSSIARESPSIFCAPRR